MRPTDPMTGFSGVLSVRKKCDGGDVDEDVSESPHLWFGGAPHIVLFVHGYNNNAMESRDAFERLTVSLPPKFPKLGWFYWPGDADLAFFDFLDVISYPKEISDARESAKMLAGRLSQLAQKNPGIEITLLGHSLGCRLILECLHLFATDTSLERPKFKAVFMMAAAVPVELVELNMPLGDAVRGLIPNIYDRWVFHSVNDMVLQLAFPVGQGAAAIIGTEEAAYFEAVGRYGNPPGLFNSINIQDMDHGDYWSNPIVVEKLCDNAGVAYPRETESRTLLTSRPLAYRELPKGLDKECPLY